MSTAHKTLVVIGAILVSSTVAAIAAFAQTGEGYIGGGNIGAGVSVPGGSGSGSSGGGVGYVPVGTGGGSSGGGGSAPTTRWVRHYYGEDPSAGYGLNAPFSCPAGQGAYEDVLVDNATGATLDTVSGCTAPAQPGQPAAPPPPPPQPPPTPQEARNLVALPVPGWGVSPTFDGLAGLAVHLWDSSSTSPKTASAVIRGYQTTTTARPVRWTWNMTESGPTSRSNPPGTVSASRPGTADAPAATYTYETAGRYTITLTVQWTGSYTFTGPGGSTVTRDLGSSDRTATRGYTVAEVRPVLVAR